MTKQNKIFSILTILILIINIFSFFNNKTFAIQTIDETISSAKNFIDGGEASEALKEKDIKENLSSIYNIFLAVGLVILVIWGLILGIKFMTGAVEQKAEIKEMFIPYTVGVVIILGSYGIWRLVIMILDSFA